MKAIVWMCVGGTYNPPGGQVLVADSNVTLGSYGPSQKAAQLSQHTIGELRAEYGLEDELASLADDRVAWLYTDDFEMGDGSNSLTMVLVDMQ